MVSMTAVGQTAEVIVWRDRREQKLTVTVGERDRTLSHVHRRARAPGEIHPGLLRRPNRPGAGSSYVLGLELATLNPELAKRIEIPESWRGALVLSVDSQSPLSRLVKPGRRHLGHRQGSHPDGRANREDPQRAGRPRPARSWASTA